MTRSELARRIYSAAHLTGHFVLRSGQTATEYFDKYRFESDPVLLDDIAQAMESENDARVSCAVLTDAGFARLERAWPTNLASVRRNFLNHLQGVDLAMLAKAFERTATPGDAAPECQPGEAPPS